MTRGVIVGLVAISAMWWLPPLLQWFDELCYRRRPPRTITLGRPQPPWDHHRIDVDVTRLTPDQVRAIRQHLPKRAARVDHSPSNTPSRVRCRTSLVGGSGLVM